MISKGLFILFNNFNHSHKMNNNHILNGIKDKKFNVKPILTCHPISKISPKPSIS